ncbi:MAG TPA: hypothetical protein DCZ12_04645, partial [Gammaproteobacteria bacterium]|nr:hypothetical protein [Gammaproteobacteria bacterium]
TIKSGGLEGDDVIGAWQGKYKRYVPLKGFADDEKGVHGTGSGFNIKGKESQRAMGRRSRSGSPLANAINDTTKVAIRNRKNEVGNALLGLVENNPNNDLWEVFTEDNPEVSRRIKRQKNPLTGEVEEVVESMPVPMAMFSDNYFTTKRDGETHYIKIKDDRLMSAMKNLGVDQGGDVIRTMGNITRIMSSLNTSFNPEFIVSNFARDIQTAIMNIQGEQTRKDGRLEGKAIAAQTAKDVRHAMRSIYRNLRGKEAKTET